MEDLGLGLRIGIRDWFRGFGLGIGIWDCWELGFGIGDWGIAVLGLGLGIRIRGLGFGTGIRDQDWRLGLEIRISDWDWGLEMGDWGYIQIFVIFPRISMNILKSKILYWQFVWLLKPKLMFFSIFCWNSSCK